MKIFEIHLKRYSAELVPPFLRGGIFNGLLSSVVDPIIDVYNQFLDSRKQNLIRINFTYQKFSIERRLNDVFDPTERRIKIVKSVRYESLYIYTEAEDDLQRSKTKWLHGESNPIYLRTGGELNSEFDFIIEIPNININQIRLKAEVDFYKLITKQYLIVVV